jgi:hypothetical protein
MKYTVEYIKELCDKKDLILVGIDTKFINKRNRRCACVLCNRHKDKGEQWLPVEKLENNKPCQYCNHSKLKETFKEEMAVINPNIEILSDYVNWNTKIKCKCKTCGYEWDGNVSSLLYGSNCKICAAQTIWDKRGRKTTEDIVTAVSDVSPHIEVLGDYTGYHNKIDCKCKIHNTQWNIKVSVLLHGGTNCPECQLKKTRDRCGLNKTEVYDKIHKMNPNVSIISEYENINTKMSFYCEKHNYHFDASPSSFLYKKSLCCPMCMYDAKRFNKQLPEELYKYYVEDVYGYIYKGKEHKDGKIFIHFLCKKHQAKGIQKIPMANMRHSKCCCRYCTGVLRNTEDFQLSIKDKLPDIEIIGEYTNSRSRIKCHCKTCGHIWNPLVYNLISGCGCPSCKKSRPEKVISYTLDKWKINYDEQVKFDGCKDVNPLPFDFYLTDFNTAIEYDGEQHYIPVNWSGEMTDEELEKAFLRIQKHDDIKTKYCEDNNIRLIRIPYWEKNNIEYYLFDYLVKYNILQKVS